MNPETPATITDRVLTKHYGPEIVAQVRALPCYDHTLMVDEGRLTACLVGACEYLAGRDNRHPAYSDLAPDLVVIARAWDRGLEVMKLDTERFTLAARLRAEMLGGSGDAAA